MDSKHTKDRTMSNSINVVLPVEVETAATNYPFKGIDNLRWQYRATLNGSRFVQSDYMETHSTERKCQRAAARAVQARAKQLREESGQ
jgi:hypothetical protein